MKIYKCRKVKTPTRGTSRSAGIDFYMPEGPTETVIHPHSDILIPSGIYAEIPKGYMLIFADKSSICTKYKLFIGAKVIDEDYQGEIHIHLINWSDQYVKITPNQKIAQAILVPVNYEDISECSLLQDLWDGKKTERGTGGFGSTNNNLFNTKDIKPFDAEGINKPFNIEAIGAGDIATIKNWNDCFYEAWGLNHYSEGLKNFIKMNAGKKVKVLETITSDNLTGIQIIDEPEKTLKVPYECLTLHYEEGSNK